MNWKILSLALLIIACEHSPKGTYYVNLNKETYGNINIDLLAQADTIILLQEANLSYNIQLQEGQVLRSIDFTIDGEAISSSLYANNMFILNPGDFETGSHLLKAEVITSTGTGSMSELAGAESLLYTREWIVLVDHTPPEALSITSIAEFNGKLKIEWTKNNNLNFRQYQVYKIFYDPITHDSNQTFIANIGDRNSNSYIDESYIGGPVSYYVLNVAYNLATVGISKFYEGPYPKFLSAQKTEADKVTFTWNKDRFPGNFGKYEITFEDKINYRTTTLFSTNNVNDTSFATTLMFGDSLEISINTSPEKLNYWYPETVSDKITVFAGEKIPIHRCRLLHSNEPGIVYLVDYDSIIRYNLETGKSEQTLRTSTNRNVLMSPNGKYLVKISGHMADLLDPVTLGVTRSVNLAPFFNNSDNLRIINVNNNGWMSVAKDEWPLCCGIVDLERGDTLFTVKGYNYASIDPSPSGKYMIVNVDWVTTLYNYNGSLIKLYYLSQDEFEFNPVNEEELYKFSPSRDNSISLLNCSDLHEINSYTPHTALGKHYIDPISGLIMISGDSKIYILDLDQKSIVATKEIIDYFSLQGYTFFNNTLFSCLGYKLSIKP